MNIATLIGRLTSDPSLSYTPNTQTAVASFRLAVDRETKEGGADFIQCKVFGRQAENLERYKHKGDSLAVHGRIETGSYKRKDGSTAYTTEVICSRVEYIGGRTEGNGVKEADSEEESADAERSVEMELPDTFAQLEDDIPF